MHQDTTTHAALRDVAAKLLRLPADIETVWATAPFAHSGVPLERIERDPAVLIAAAASRQHDLLGQPVPAGTVTLAVLLSPRDADHLAGDPATAAMLADLTEHGADRGVTVIIRPPVLALFDEASALLGAVATTPAAAGAPPLLPRLPVYRLSPGPDTAPRPRPYNSLHVDEFAPAAPAPALQPQIRRDDADANPDVLAALQAELRERGFPPAALYDVDDIAAAQQLLGMDEAQPWHAVSVVMPDDPIGSWTEDAIRGRDRAEALANAHWNWPTAWIGYLGHSYEDGDRVQELAAPRRRGAITRTLANIDGRPAVTRLFARFDGEAADVEVSRVDIEFVPPGTVVGETR